MCPNVGIHVGRITPLTPRAILGGRKPTHADFDDFRTFGTRADFSASQTVHRISDTTRGHVAAGASPADTPPSGSSRPVTPALPSTKTPRQARRRKVRPFPTLLSSPPPPPGISHLTAATDLVREKNATNASIIDRSNSVVDDLIHKRPIFKIGLWVWVNNSLATIRQGTKKGANDAVLKDNPCLSWTSPFKIPVIGSLRSTPDGHPVRDKPIQVELSSDIRDKDAKHRVSVARCKPCHNPHDTSACPSIHQLASCNTS